MGSKTKEHTITAMEFRGSPGTYLDLCARGATVRVTKRGGLVAVLVPPEGAGGLVPDDLLDLHSRTVLADLVRGEITLQDLLKAYHRPR